MKKRNLQVEANPREDYWLPVLRKIQKELRQSHQNFLLRGGIAELGMRGLENEISRNLTPTEIEETVTRYKDNNLYMFMVDLVIVSRLYTVISHLDVRPLPPRFSRFVLGFSSHIPTATKIIDKRKLWDIDVALDRLGDPAPPNAAWFAPGENIPASEFEIVDHIDAMLQIPGVRRELKQLGAETKQGMTLADVLSLHQALKQIEGKYKQSVEGKGLKEAPWESIRDKKFYSVLTDKQPPYVGVIPSGPTFVEGENFKWVDLYHSSVEGGTDALTESSNTNELYAPYEAFYVRHCGRDIGNRLISLRVKMGGGWFPIAMATLKFRGGEMYNTFAITQLKTFRNADYWCPGVEAVEWLKNRGVSEDDLRKAVLMLFMDNRISVLENGPDLNYGTFKDDKKFSDKLLGEVKRYVLAHAPHAGSPITRVFGLMAQDPDSKISIDPVFKNVQEYLESSALSYFTSLLKSKLHSFQGLVAFSLVRGNSGNKEGLYRIRIKEFHHLYDAEEFYWERFPETREEHEAGSGDRIRFELSSYNTPIYIERIVYLPPPMQAALNVYIRIKDTVSPSHVDFVLDNMANFFIKRWKSYYDSLGK